MWILLVSRRKPYMNQSQIYSNHLVPVPHHALILEKSECYEAIDTADTVSNQMDNTYYIEPIPDQ